jgi:putative Holliday junction resolvase
MKSPLRGGLAGGLNRVPAGALLRGPGGSAPPRLTSRSMRYVAVDLGDKRTGLAVGDTVTGLVSPLSVVEVAIAHGRGEALMDELVSAIDEQLGPAGELVFGLPLNMDGSEGPRAGLVRAFAARLAERTGRRMHFQDERLTSAGADWSLARSGLTHGQKKRRRDALAAAAILRDFLSGLSAARQQGAEDEPKEPG